VARMASARVLCEVARWVAATLWAVAMMELVRASDAVVR